MYEVIPFCASLTILPSCAPCSLEKPSRKPGLTPAFASFKILLNRVFSNKENSSIFLASDIPAFASLRAFSSCMPSSFESDSNST